MPLGISEFIDFHICRKYIFLMKTATRNIEPKWSVISRRQIIPELIESAKQPFRPLSVPREGKSCAVFFRYSILFCICCGHCPLTRLSRLRLIHLPTARQARHVANGHQGNQLSVPNMALRVSRKDGFDEANALWYHSMPLKALAEP